MDTRNDAAVQDESMESRLASPDPRASAAMHPTSAADATSCSVAVHSPGQPAWPSGTATAASKLSAWLCLILWALLSFGVPLLVISVKHGEILFIPPEDVFLIAKINMGGSVFMSPSQLMGGVTLVPPTPVHAARWPFILLYTLPFILSPLLLAFLRRLLHTVDSWFRPCAPHPVGGALVSVTDAILQVMDAVVHWVRARDPDTGQGRFEWIPAVMAAGVARTRGVAVRGWHATANRAAPIIKSVAVSQAAKASAEWTRRTVTAEDLRMASSRTVKGAMAVAGLLILQGVLTLALESRSYRFSAYDWLSLFIKLSIVGIAVRLHGSIILIVSTRTALWMQNERRPAWHTCCGNGVGVAGNLTRLAIVIILGMVLLPKLAKFNQFVLKTEWLTTLIILIGIVMALIMLFNVWANLSPLIDLLRNRIGERGAPAAKPFVQPSSQSGRICLQCQTVNDDTAIFCASCGTSIPPPPASPPAKPRCRGCGAENDADSKFCFSCGEPL